MTTPEIEADITTRSRTFGILLGILSLPTAFVGGALGSCCPLGSAVGVAPVVLWSGLGGFLAAMFLDWSRIAHEDAVGVGARVGLRTGLLASVIGAGLTFVIAMVGAGTLGAGLAEQEGEALGYGTALSTMNLVMCALAVVPGTLLATLGGVIGAAIKRK